LKYNQTHQRTRELAHYIVISRYQRKSVLILKFHSQVRSVSLYCHCYLLVKAMFATLVKFCSGEC